MNAVVDASIDAVAQQRSIQSEKEAPPDRGSDPRLALVEDVAIEAVEKFMQARIEEACPNVLGTKVTEHVATGGKRLRARLALRVAMAMGAAQSDAVVWAAAVELLHNATLVHDDLQDGDRVRRGQPTVWVRYGAAQAINVGDFMLMLPTACLDAIRDPAHRGLLATELSKYALRTVRGQAVEMTLLPAGRLDPDSYGEAIQGKTGALLALPVLGAAILAGWSLNGARSLAKAFERLGVLFQLQDDVCDLYGDKGRDQVGCDIYEGKVSALVVEHLRRVPGDRRWLSHLLQAPRSKTSEPDVARVIALFRKSGALAAVIKDIRKLEIDMKSDECLMQVPQVRQVALSLCELATSSIRHLYIQKPNVTDQVVQEEKCA